jgi:hypothetical protein
MTPRTWAINIVTEQEPMDGLGNNPFVGQMGPHLGPFPIPSEC